MSNTINFVVYLVYFSLIFEIDFSVHIFNRCNFIFYFCDKLFCTYALSYLELGLHVLQNPYFVLEVEAFLSVLARAAGHGLIVSDRVLFRPKVR